VALSHAERGQIGGRKHQASLTPEQRQESMRKARLAAAVKAVVDRAQELTPDQVQRLRSVFAPE
jgi:hypothetical protein